MLSPDCGQDAGYFKSSCLNHDRTLVVHFYVTVFTVSMQPLETNSPATLLVFVVFVGCFVSNFFFFSKAPTHSLLFLRVISPFRKLLSWLYLMFML